MEIFRDEKKNNNNFVNHKIASIFQIFYFS